MGSQQWQFWLRNYLTSDILGSDMTGQLTSVGENEAVHFATLMRLVETGTINSRTAKDLLSEVITQGADPEELVTERGLGQSNSAEELLPIVEAIIAEQAAVVAEFKAGKEASLKFLVGQGMKLSKGTANPALLAELLEQQIKES